MIFKPSFFGALIGLFIGLLFGIGVLYTVKKRQKESLMLPSMAIFGGIGLVWGLKVGYSIGTDDKKVTLLGINTAQTNYFKQGRSWVAITKWIEPATKKENVLVTGKSDSGEVV